VTDTVLDTRDLSMRFGGVQAVNNVNFSLKERELRCLIGPNGAGKSTFFKCLTGQIRLNLTHGRVFIRGHDVTGWRAYEIVRLGVGIKTQVPSVMNGLSVEENLWLSARRVSGREAVGAVVAEVIRSSFTNQGQICLCGSRILVERRIYPGFLERFVAKRGPIMRAAEYEHTLEGLRKAGYLG